MIIENVPTLKIHKLTQEQYDRELAAGNLDENAIYLTPDEAVDMSEYVTTEQFETSMDAIEIPKKVSELTNDTSVAYSASQNLTDAQKAQARANIGASDFDGNYSSLSNIPSLYTQEEVDAMIANKADKLTDQTEVIVDNADGSDSSLQSFVYTLPSDDTVITVDGWGMPDAIYFNYQFAEGMDSGDYYSIMSASNPLSLPADLPSEAIASWKSGTVIKVIYNSDIITSAVATVPCGNYATENYVDAKVEDTVDAIEAVKYTEQSLTEEQKIQVRNNIGVEQSLINQTLGYTKKNLLPYPFRESSHTDNGIVWTDNGDGTVTANGTATSSNSVYYFSRSLVLPVGKYTISGCPSGGASEKYLFRISDEENPTTTIFATDYGNGDTFELTEEKTLRIYLRIYAGFTVSNLTFKPMIRSADIADNTFQPYVEDVNTRLEKLNNQSMQSICDIQRQFRVLKQNNGEPFYPQGMCYVNGNLVLSFCMLEGNDVVLEEYSLTGELIRQAQLPLYHTNSLAYNPNTNEIYVATLKYYDESGVETYIREVARVDYDTFTINSRTTYTTEKGELVYVLYDQEKNRMLASTKYAVYEIGDTALTKVYDLELPTLGNLEETPETQNITKYKNRYYRVGSTPNHIEVFDNNFNTIFMKSFEQFYSNVQLGEVEAIAFGEDGDFYIYTAARNHSYKYIIANVFKGNIYRNVLIDEKNCDNGVHAVGEIYVDSNVHTVNPTGTETNPFNNLDEAILYMCSPNALVSRIVLVQGNYEGVCISCPKLLEIRGNNSTIDGIYATNNSLILRDVTITHNSTINAELNYPMVFYRCSRVYLRNVNVQGATVNNAIYSHETELAIDNLTFTDCTSNYYIYNSSGQPVLYNGKKDINIRDAVNSGGTPVNATVSLSAANDTTSFSKGLLYNIKNKVYDRVTVIAQSSYGHSFSAVLKLGDLIDNGSIAQFHMYYDQKLYIINIQLTVQSDGNFTIASVSNINTTNNTLDTSSLITITNLKFE